MKSAISHIVWPAVPAGLGARLVAMQHQFDATQWLAPEELERRQMAALGRLLGFARSTVPYYRDEPAYAGAGPSNGAALDAEAWRRLPVLRRDEIQDAGERLHSAEIPPSHRPTAAMMTSGSTGRPLTVLTTNITNGFWLATTLREHLWQGRDSSCRAAVIRPDPARKVPPGGSVQDSWGLPFSEIYRCGPLGLMSLQTDVNDQAEWLVSQNPEYLLTLPSNLFALAAHFEANGMKLPNLRQVSSMGEILGLEVRDACRDVFGVEIADMYSSQELGYISLQCPEQQVQHVQSELVYLEVLDEAGDPCRPGETGRVVVTPLHNYAMPLMRYEVGDYAEVGEPCPCGRGLPVLTRVMGRRRNMLTLPTGETLWPTFGEAWKGIDAIRQIQLVQTSADVINARIVGPRALTPEEAQTFSTKLVECLGYPFAVTFEHLDRIDRSRHHKFEDFVSLTPAQGRP